MSTTFSLQKSKKLLNEQGYDTWIVEKPFNPYTKRREDLYNLIDVIGIKADVQGVIGVQACGEDVSNHVRKILEGSCDTATGKIVPPNPHLAIWIRNGNRFFIWSWCLRGAKGKRKTYRLRQIEFLLKDGIVTPYEIPMKEEGDL